MVDGQAAEHLSLVACTASGALAVMRRRPLERPVHELVGLDDLVEQPELERPRGRERLGGEQELHGRREGELAGQARRWCRRRRTGPASAPSRRSVACGGGDADVDAAEHLHAAGHARPVDRGDDRLVELEAAQHGVGAVAELAAVDLVDLARADLLLRAR